MRPTARRSGFTLVEIMIVIGIIALLMGLLLPAVLRARESGRRTACTNNQYQLAFAVQRHADSSGVLVGWRNPSPNPANRSSGTYTPSWPVLLLPFIERTDLYTSWTSATVGPATQINTLLCPCSPPDSPGRPTLSYAGNVGTCGVAGVPGNVANKYDGVLLDVVVRANAITPDDISNADGTGTTLLLSEKSGSVVTQGYWDVCPTTATQFAYSGGSTAYAAGSSLPVPGFGVTGAAITPVLNSLVSGAPGAWSQPSSNHPDGVVVAFCDSHTLFLKNTIAPQVYAQLITSNNAKASSIPRSNWGTAAYALSDDDYQ